ncbi:MarR family transcriptional regulator [Gottschalkiaceae bacterium SANA]|nr:MarR family transcriptional regulator [Gottschalkiaceae bacterium SANA]
MGEPMSKDSTKTLINQILVELFHDILEIEEQSITTRTSPSITVNEMHIIEIIGLNQARSMGEVARDLGITLPSLTSGINRLVKKGYVERKRTEEDRRVVKVELTKSGRQIFRAHELFHNQMVEALIHDLEIEELPLLMNSLEQLRDFFRNRYFKK